jgi:2-dehydropantoate 2-reductase
VTQDKPLRIAVIGAGAIGGVTSAFLTRAGWDPEIVCKHQETVDRGIGEGFSIRGRRGEDRIRVRAVRQIGDLSGSKDVVLLATKATECVTAAKALLPFLEKEAVVVSLQNGICEEALSEILGRDRVIGCVVAWGATLHGPGQMEVTSDGEFVIGSLDNAGDERLETLRQMLDTVVPTRISDNVMGELYSKLIINSCINSLGVIAGVRLGKLLARRKTRSLFIKIMGEAVAVADAMGIRVAPGGGGKLDYYRFLSGTGFFARIRQHMVIRAIGFKYRRIRSSSLQSLERGRQTEIDFLNGYICDQGRKNGVETPLNDAVVKMIKAIEIGERPISMENLNDPVFAAI